MVPDAAQIIVRAGPGASQLVWQKAAHAEQARLKRERRAALFQFTREQERKQLGDAPHRPDVLLVTERGEQTLPERLFPADLPGAGGEFGRLALQAKVRRLLQHFAQNVFRQIAQRRAALASEQAGRVRIVA